VVYCEFLTPIGIPTKAEILDGDCMSFTNEANATYYTEGIATAVHVPMLTDDEMRQDIFNHTYCARLDFVYEGKSVVEKRVSVLDYACLSCTLPLQLLSCTDTHSLETAVTPLLKMARIIETI